MLRVAALTLCLSLPVLAASPDAGVKPRVAVLYFEARTNDPDVQAFTKGLAELMINDLLATDAVRVVERARLEEVLAELKLGESRFADASTFAKAGKLLGADYLVLGSVIQAGKKFALSPRVVDPRTGEVVAPLKNVTFQADDVLLAEQQVVADLAQGLQGRGIVGAVTVPPARPHKLPVGTAAKYARALDAKDKKDRGTQKQLLTEVVKDQPDFKLAQADLLTLRD